MHDFQTGFGKNISQHFVFPSAIQNVKNKTQIYLPICTVVKLASHNSGQHMANVRFRTIEQIAALHERMYRRAQH
jgi:hypothetical protein